MTRKYYYAVIKGRVPGIYESYAECEEQVFKFKGCKFKRFKTKGEAIKYVKEQEKKEAARLEREKENLNESN